nr:MAG TPA: hypothetical protein [Caudoviricetes sp.]
MRLYQSLYKYIYFIFQKMNLYVFMSRSFRKRLALKKLKM